MQSVPLSNASYLGQPQIVVGIPHAKDRARIPPSANDQARRSPSRAFVASAQGVVMDYQEDTVGMYTSLLSERVVVDEVWDDTQNYSQCGEQPIPNEIATPPVRPNNKRSKKFSNEEDQVLVSAWLHASLDPIVGNEQKNATYWKRIHEEYELHKPKGSDRNISSLTHRWAVVKEQVGRFCGCFEQIANRNASGKTEQDKIVEACTMYKATDKTQRTFGLLHCWSLLRFSKKWMAQIDRSSQSNKKQKSSSNASPSMSAPGCNAIHIDDNEATSPAKPEHMRRPIGKNDNVEVKMLALVMIILL